MYKAIHTQTGAEIIILHPDWLRKIDQLREMDRQDLLVCQGCRQPMRVKAGEMKRPHFAHKHLAACSYGSESPEILNARAVLYQWLLSQFGQGVTVEKLITDSGLPRPVDCWVETKRGIFAYWIIEAGIKLEPRMAIKAAFERAGVKIHYVFLSGMLHEEKKEFHSLLLSPTERFFLQATPYDDLFTRQGETGKTIHYLEAGAANYLTTFRGLVLYHPPNWFRGRKKTASLETIRASTLDGSFLYPGENSQLSARQQKQQHLEEKRKRYEEEQQQLSSRRVQRPPARNWGLSQSNAETGGDAAPEALTCVTCGRITTDYWSTFFDESGRKLCRCRECLARESG